MEGLALIGLLIIAGIAASKRNGFDDIYRSVGERRGVDWRLLKAVAIVESSEDPEAVNPNDPSYGLMQILCAGTGDRCANKLYVEGWPPLRSELTSNPRLNVDIGAQILRYNIDKFGFRRGIAAYNNWSARFDPEGAERNKGYVDRVLNEYRRLT